jgi:hypothetical protein
VEVERADPFAPESLRLIGALWSELGALSPEMEAPLFPPRDIFGARAFFVLASLGGEAIGLWRTER